MRIKHFDEFVIPLKILEDSHINRLDPLTVCLR